MTVHALSEIHQIVIPSDTTVSIKFMIHAAVFAKYSN